jgi:ABC-type spermidine/putrescine transport system permease subunit II
LSSCWPSTASNPCRAIAVAFLTIFIVVPLVNVFVQAFAKGIEGYFAVFWPPPPPDGATLNVVQKRHFAEGATQAARTRSFIGMTLAVAAVVVPLNIVFGLAAAWATTKFRFRGRALLVSLIDLPFSVSPVAPAWRSCCSAATAFSATGRRISSSLSCSRCIGRASSPAFLSQSGAGSPALCSRRWPFCSPAFSSPFPSSRVR